MASLAFICWVGAPALLYIVYKFDELVKSSTTTITVIPAKAGIQFFQVVADHLDSGFRRSDDFLQSHQILIIIK